MIFGYSKSVLRNRLVWAPALAVAVLWESWGSGARADDLPRVVTTTTVVADLVRQVAGDRVAIDCLMAPGVDPHSYKATPRDADRLSRADLVVASGLHLEGKLSDLLERLAGKARVVHVTDAMPRDRLIEVAPGVYDPHVWFDARLWATGVPPVVEGLSAIDPGGRDTFTRNAAELIGRLETLDEEIRRRMAAIPEAQRVMVTAHDAFRYFGKAYGIEVMGVQGTSTESEAGLNDINRLVDLVVERRIPSVFVETSVADRNVKALQEGARSRGHALKLGGSLYSDSLGAAASGADTLEAALRANVEVVVTGLTGGR